jgi:DNA-3-methyladenine glycosylase II
MNQTLTIESIEIQYLHMAYPLLKPFFASVGRVSLPAPSQTPVADAVILHIIGQMLSAKAAVTIHRRLLLASEAFACRPWHLDEERLRECGLSRRKSRTIREFGIAYDARPENIELWRSLPFPSLLQEVRKFWGLSDWTASMLAIFHFGHRDVFPLSDGSITRVVALIETRFLRGKGSFDPSLASPFGTQLAIIFWASLDRGYWHSS